MNPSMQVLDPGVAGATPINPTAQDSPAEQDAFGEVLDQHLHQDEATREESPVAVVTVAPGLSAEQPPEPPPEQPPEQTPGQHPLDAPAVSLPQALAGSGVETPVSGLTTVSVAPPPGAVDPRTALGIAGPDSEAGAVGSFPDPAAGDSARTPASAPAAARLIAQAPSQARSETVSSAPEQNALDDFRMTSAATQSATGSAMDVSARAAQSRPPELPAGSGQALAASVSGSSAALAHPQASAGIAQFLPPVANFMHTGSPVPVMPQALPVLEHPLGDGQWNQAFGQRIVWALDHGVQAASLALHPRELGPVTIQIALANDEARLHFNAAHGLTRDAIEAALPRLREMLHSSGIALAQVDIGDHPQTQAGHGGSRQQGGDAPVYPQHQEAPEAAQPTPVVVYASRGLVDTFV